MKYLFIPITITSFLSLVLGLFWPIREYYDVIIKIGFVLLCVIDVASFLLLYKISAKKARKKENVESKNDFEIVYWGFGERNVTRAGEKGQAKLNHGISKKVWLD